jgi:segregation and condensation protein B
MTSLKNVVEALVFASQKPLLPKDISAALRGAVADSEDGILKEIARTKEAEIAAILEQLKIEYIESGRAFQLVEEFGGWKVVTGSEYAPWVRRLFPESKPSRLSGPALETLAIISYRQPITRADVEAVRGVAVDGIVQLLLERGLVKIGGRAEIPGRPLLYETTPFFLEHFGLRTLDELPNCEELRRVNLPTAALPPEPAEPVQP